MLCVAWVILTRGRVQLASKRVGWAEVVLAGDPPRAAEEREKDLFLTDFGAWRPPGVAVQPTLFSVGGRDGRDVMSLISAAHAARRHDVRSRRRQSQPQRFRPEFEGVAAADQSGASIPMPRFKTAWCYATQMGSLGSERKSKWPSAERGRGDAGSAKQRKPYGEGLISLSECRARQKLKPLVGLRLRAVQFHVRSRRGRQCESENVKEPSLALFRREPSRTVPQRAQTSNSECREHKRCP